VLFRSDQPKHKPLTPSTIFKDGGSARPLVAGTVARGELRTDDFLYKWKVGDKLVDRFPFPITRADLDRGRERFNIFCSTCHDRTGGGRGIVILRGFRPPPSYHIDRLREAPVGHFFDVMTRGFGAMPDYSAQVPPADRWRIAAYIRALQLSQHARPEDVPAEEMEKLR
jgi:mono/diheme cytochrome c family protein